MPEIELALADHLAKLETSLGPIVDPFRGLVEGERSLVFPFEWKTDAELSAGLEAFAPTSHVPRLALARISSPVRGLRLVRLSDLARSTALAVLEPWVDDSVRKTRLLGLWTQGTEVLR